MLVSIVLYVELGFLCITTQIYNKNVSLLPSKTLFSVIMLVMLVVSP